MSNDAVAAGPYRPWWQHWEFPLVPVLTYRKRDDWNAAHLGLQWLCFHLWSLSHIVCGVRLEADTRRIQAQVLLPYLSFCVSIPFAPYNSFGSFRGFKG